MIRDFVWIEIFSRLNVYEKKSKQLLYTKHAQLHNKMPRARHFVMQTGVGDSNKNIPHTSFYPFAFHLTSLLDLSPPPHTVSQTPTGIHDLYTVLFTTTGPT